MSHTVVTVLERGRGNRCDQPVETGNGRRWLLITGLTALFSAGLAPGPIRAGVIGSPVIAGGYTFINFDGPNSGVNAGAGTNVNGIANNGAAVGFSLGNAGLFTNFVRNPDGTFTTLNLGGAGSAMAMGINSAGDVVGTQNGTAFFLPNGGLPGTLTTPAGATTAFGVNDQGNIVGQFNSATASPGFFLANSAGNGLITINPPSGPNIVNAQGVNDNGLVVGFYVGTDGQDHGFITRVSSAQNGSLSGTGVADPAIPNVAGEPGATFVFSQILGVNDSGIAVGYYGDSTTSQHGFFYNRNTGAYLFLDDPSEQFSNGVEVTQITGINNSGEIAGFYSDASGVFHGFVACPTGVTCTTSVTSPTPEPSSLVFASFGLGVLAFRRFLHRRNSLSA